MKVLKSRGEKIFDAVNNIFMFLIIIVMLYPMINQIAISFSSNSAIISGKVSVWPIQPTLDAYREIVADKNFFRSMGNTVFFTITATVTQIVFTSIFAYPLSKKHLKGRSVIMSLLVFSMMFGTGGLIPTYLLIRNLHLIDSYAAIILPGAISIWNTIVIKNFFQQVPESLEEAAIIDGAGILRVFVSIVLPLSVPVLAAITLFAAVWAWNVFFEGIVYITSPSKKLLQMYLNDILQANIGSQTGPNTTNNDGQILNTESLKAAALICTIAPIIMVYPFVQKYFMTGLMIGAVKG